MATKAFGGAMLNLFPSLGPALMISMGYIDLGKWVAAVEGGARFGFDLVLLVFLFNFAGILCQYLAARIGMVTGKNLAEICREEYSKSACLLLGVQAELSMIISDLTTILGMAHGLNLLFEMDLVICVLFVTVGAVLLPLFVTLLGNNKAAAWYMCTGGLALLIYVFGVLISQPEIPLMINGIFPKLSGENIYSLMALLGSNIMAHNFYIHSSLVQQQNRSQNAAIGALFHDHLFAILFIFTGIFLVNYVLMNSAAAVFSSADVVLNFQDVSLLMDQIFKRPIAPIAFFVVLLLSSQATALSWNIGGEVILRYFFRADLSTWSHLVFLKALSIIPALYCATSTGAEGIYQLLIFCQVILAMLLPSSVIPLFRVASSRFVMGKFKVSWLLEILALFAFLGIFAVNIIFAIEMLFGNSSWIMNIRGGMGSSVMVPYAILLLIACTSLGLTFYLAVTPLKTASDGPGTHTSTWRSMKDQPELSEGRGSQMTYVVKYDEENDLAVESTLDKSTGSQSDKSILEFNLDLSDTSINCDHDANQFAHSSDFTFASASSTCQPEESKSSAEVDLSKNLNMASARDTLDPGTDSSTVFSAQEILQRGQPKSQDEKEMGVHASVPTSMGNEGDALEPEVSRIRALPASTSEGPGSSNNIKEGGTGSGSLSKLSGLGRAARRQLAAILDEFWGTLFDFHGKLIQDASADRFDVILGLDVKIVGSGKPGITGAQSSQSFYTDVDRGQVFPGNINDCNSPKPKKIPIVESSPGAQIGSSSWSHAMQSNTHLRSSCGNLLGPSERPYSSYLPLNSDNQDYQPATIHGYQLASYLNGIGAGRNPYSPSISPHLPQAPNPGASFLPNLRDQVMYTRMPNELGSSGTPSLQIPAMSRIGRFPVERPFYGPSFPDTSGNVSSSSSTKKYHSSPDISVLIAATRNSLMNDGKWGGPIGPRQTSGRMAYERSQYLSNTSSSGVPIPFDELSPPKLHRDIFSLQSNLSTDPKSLWSTQPFEQLFGMTGKDQTVVERGINQIPSTAQKDSFTYADSEAKLLRSFRFCILKLLKLEGSDWLFRQNGGCDEELIDRVASMEKYLQESDATERSQAPMAEAQHLSSVRRFSSPQSNVDEDIPSYHLLPDCGDACIWKATLVVSFGVWCIRRILELALVESRPELWGKYTYVLNRLQGIIEPAFHKPRHSLSPCICLQIPARDNNRFNPSLQNEYLLDAEKSSKNSFTSAGVVLEIIKDVEAAVSGRKGRTGTAAGDVAFPKGKENLASVLKRYKRRLLNKFPGTNEGITLPRKIPTPASVL